MGCHNHSGTSMSAFACSHQLRSAPKDIWMSLDYESHSQRSVCMGSPRIAKDRSSARCGPIGRADRQFPAPAGCVENDSKTGARSGNKDRDRLSYLPGDRHHCPISRTVADWRSHSRWRRTNRPGQRAFTIGAMTRFHSMRSSALESNSPIHAGGPVRTLRCTSPPNASSST